MSGSQSCEDTLQEAGYRKASNNPIQRWSLKQCIGWRVARSLFSTGPKKARCHVSPFQFLRRLTLFPRLYFLIYILSFITFKVLTDFTTAKTRPIHNCVILFDLSLLLDSNRKCFAPNRDTIFANYKFFWILYF